MEPEPLPQDDGYRGIWYAIQPTGDRYAYKYSGGLATYPQQIAPFACHAQEVGRTFFCYGGAPRGANRLLHCLSYYDHATGTVPRPRVLLDKATEDAHDNPALLIDAAGHLMVFSNSHGTSRPSFVHRGVEPHSIERFERVADFNFSYSQPWALDGGGILMLHTSYGGDERGPIRRLCWRTSPDGRAWSEPSLLAACQRGHYQVSGPCGDRVGTAFNYHPDPAGVDARTNLYYLQTDDLGQTWRTAAGEPVEVPLTTVRNAALVHDYASEGLLVYLKTVRFDGNGNPVILFLTSRGFEPGPANDPRAWRTARWTGDGWAIREVARSDNNYDFGPLYIEPDGTWRLIAPLRTGPQPYNPGGEIVTLTSRDMGMSWREVGALTRDSDRNHTYVRAPLGAHPDFYALWADGDGRRPSESCLYFTNRAGDRVRRLPRQMDGEAAEPEPLSGSAGR